MNDKEIKVLLQKSNELRALFVLGQRVIPFLEEIFVFVSEIQPLLEEINVSIKENLNKMPSASKQLSKVTEATELATNEIMDIVDGLVYKSDIISSNMKKMQELDQMQSTKPLEILELVMTAIKDGANLNEILPELSATVKLLKQNRTGEFENVVKSTSEILQSIVVDSSSIMISLQVQDITSQQIAAVNKLLETVQDKLSIILKHFENSDVQQMVAQEVAHYDRTNVSHLHRDIAFDPEAVEALSMKENRQSMVDRFINEHHSDTEDNSKDNDNQETNIEDEFPSQEDIDKLFSSGSIEQENEDKNGTEISDDNSTTDEESKPVENLDEMLEQFSQDEIDKMFGD